MKLKLIVFFTAGVIAMGLLLGASAAQAATVILEGDNVTRIDNLDVSGTFYNVVFEDGTGEEVYGSEYVFDFPAPPPEQPFDATSAMTAVNGALNAHSSIPTGAGSQGSERFHIGFSRLGLSISLTAGQYDAPSWGLCNGDINCLAGIGATLTTATLTWAKFTETAAPEQFTIGGNVTGLVGSGLVLQNNGGDDATITGTGNVPFTFATSLAAGSPYNVTVSVDPSSPDQACSVTNNGSGTVSDQNVTNVAVTCEAPVEPPVVDTAFLPAVYLLLLLSDEGVPPEQVTVPDVVGKSQAEAESAIGAADLTVGTVDNQSHESVPNGDVISQDPVADTLVNSGSAVNLVVSTGPAGGEQVLFESTVEGKATGISNLDVDGTLYNVAFLESAAASTVYGPDLPGVFDFTTADAAWAAVDAVNAALTAADALMVGGDTGITLPAVTADFYIAWESIDTGGPPRVTAQPGSIRSDTWARLPLSDYILFWSSGDEKTYADFTEASP